MVEMDQQTLAVVILNWNGKHFLEKFLPTVIEYSKPYRVVLADNASTDNSVEFVQLNFPSVEIIQNKTNSGFAKGYNDALQQVDTDYYILLNSDVEVTPNWIPPLIEQMQDKQVAGCQPKIKSYENRTYFEYAGAAGGFLDNDYYPFCRGRIFDTLEEDKGQYDDTVEVFWTSGACMLIRSEAYHLVGGLDEDFFAHMEEIDLCWRLKRLGYKFTAVGSSEIYHVGGGTLNYLSPKKTYLNFRNSLIMIAKNHSGWRFGKLFWRLSLDGIAAIRFLVKGELKHVQAIWNAHIHFYKQLRKTKNKRVEFNNTHSIQPNLSGLISIRILWRYFVAKKKTYVEIKKS